LEEWQHDQQEFHNKHSHTLQQPGPEEILGFPVTEKFQSELSRQFTPKVTDPVLKRVLILAGKSEFEAALLKGWVEVYQRQGIEVTMEDEEDIAIWRREPMEAIVPAKTIRRIVKWITEV